MSAPPPPESFPPRPRDRHRRAWSLTELLLVLAILIFLMSALVRQVLVTESNNKIKRAQAEIRALELALEQYKADFGDYPMGQAWTRANSYGGGNSGCGTVTSNDTTEVAAGTKYRPRRFPWTDTTHGCYARHDNADALAAVPAGGYAVTNAVAGNAAALWIWLYAEPQVAGRRPYLTFNSEQLRDSYLSVPSSVYSSLGYPSGSKLPMVVDPWGNPYNYDPFTPLASGASTAAPIRKNQRSFDLFSAGPRTTTLNPSAFRYEDGNDIKNWEESF